MSRGGRRNRGSSLSRPAVGRGCQYRPEPETATLVGDRSTTNLPESLNPTSATLPDHVIADMVTADPFNADTVVSAEPHGSEPLGADALMTVDGLSPATLDRVADIVDRARERNLDRAEELAGWVMAAEQGELTTDGRMVAAEVAHQLAGSAGTFGYQDATEKAREVEAIFTDGETAQWQRASDCIQAVIGELHEAPTQD